MELAIGIIIGLAIGISLSFLLVRGRDALIAVKDKENGRLADELSAITAKFADITEKYNTAIAENYASKAVAEAKEAQFREQEKQFAAQLEIVKGEFRELSAELLKSKSLELGEQNKQQLSPLIDSLKEQMT